MKRDETKLFNEILGFHGLTAKFRLSFINVNFQLVAQKRSGAG